MIVLVSKEEAVHHNVRPGVMRSGQAEGMPWVGPAVECGALP